MMLRDIDARIARVLDKLDSPYLTEEQIDKLERKLRILREQQAQDEARESA